MKKRVPIDLLLQWAFREELPKGRRVEASPWELIENYASLGTRVQTSGYNGGFGFVSGEPHPDAQELAAAVRGLPTRASLATKELEVLLDRFAACDPLAARAVAQAPFNPRALVMRCAVLGGAMEWEIGEPIPEAVLYAQSRKPIVFGLNRDGDLVEVRIDPRSRRYSAACTMLRCHLQWTHPTIGALAETRVEYALWHRALCDIARDIAERDMLVDHIALPPRAAAMPWRSGETDKPRVLKGASADRLFEKLALKPSRARAGRPIMSAIEAESRRRPRRARLRRKPDAAGISC